MIEFTFTSGAREGSTARITGNTITIGRHPKSDLRFDTQRDLAVSTRHATIELRGERYVLRDEESRNGTYVNGQRLSAPHLLKTGDVVRFGAKGPEVKIRLKEDIIPPHTVEEPVQIQKPQARPSTALRVRVEVAKQTRTLRRMALTSIILLIAVGGAFIFYGFQQQHTRQTELDAMTARADSIQQAARQTISTMTSEMEGLSAAFREAQSQVEQLRLELSQAGDADDAEMERLRNALAAAERRQIAMSQAAAVDYESLERTLAAVVVQFANGERTIGSAFGVRSDRTLLTARHVVAGPDGTWRADRIAIKFARSPQWFQGEIIRVSPNHDLAVISVRLAGTIPTVSGFNVAQPRLGAPVTILGFPHGLDLPMEGQGNDAIIRPTLTAGVVSRIVSGTIQINGYSAPGASGSPVFGQDGRVIGVITGGQSQSGGLLVFAEPASAIDEILRAR